MATSTSAREGPHLSTKGTHWASFPHLPQFPVSSERQNEREKSESEYLQPSGGSEEQKSEASRLPACVSQ